MDTPSKTTQPRVIALVLALLVLAAYWPVCFNGFIALDDPDYVLLNRSVCNGFSWSGVAAAFTQPCSGNWHPLTLLSHMLDVELWGMHPWGHHLMSLLLHLANTLLLFAFLLRTTQALWRSALVAALFAVHPLHVESVAWVAERKDLLSAFFLMLALLSYAEYVRLKNRPAPTPVPASRGEPKPVPSRPLAGLKMPRTLEPEPLPARERAAFWLAGRPAGFWYQAALLSFALGLLSKPMLVTLPFVLLLLDGWPLRRWQFDLAGLKRLGALALEKLPFLALAVLDCVLTFKVQQQRLAVVGDLALLPRVLNAICAYLWYLGKMVWPVDLAPFYPHPWLHKPLPNPWPAWQIAAALIFLLTVSLWAFWRARRQPWFALGWFWFLGMLVPVIGLVQVGAQAYADRYSYLPLIGVFLCLAWGLAALTTRWPALRPPVVILSCLALLLCVWAAAAQTARWRNTFSLFTHSAEVTADNFMAYTLLGNEYARSNRLGLAESALLRANQAVGNFEAANFELGQIYEATGRPELAIQHYNLAIQERPSHVQAHRRLAELYWKAGNQDQGLVQMLQAVRWNPQGVQERIDLGGMLVQIQDLESARSQYAYAVRLAPGNPVAHYNLGLVLSSQGKCAAAIDELFRAVACSPDYDEACAELGKNLAALGRWGEALTYFQKAVSLVPANANYQVNLGQLFWLNHRTNEAAACYAKARDLNPALVPDLLDSARKLLALKQLQPAQARLATVGQLLPAQNPPSDWQRRQLQLWQQAESLAVEQHLPADALSAAQTIQSLAVESGDAALARQAAQRIARYQVPAGSSPEAPPRP